MSPLDRAHITAASRIMLPTYVVFFGVIGVNFLGGPSDRVVASPMLRYADQLMSIRAWGVLFLACCLLMVAALALRHRELYRWALLVCGLSMTVWALVAIAGAFTEPVSFSAWAWPALAAAACFASNRSLVKHETTGPDLCNRD